MNGIDRNSPWRPWVLLFALALAVRLLAVQLLWAPAEEPRTYEHGEIARNLLDGRGFRVVFLGAERATSQQAPFYPYLLAGSYLVWGENSPQAELALQVTQCFAGALVCLGVVALTRAVLPGNSGTAWIAGVGAALYPPHVYMVTHLQVALWAALWLVWLAAWTLGADANRPWRSGIVAGLLAGMLLLTEPILALALPILALALWRRSASARHAPQAQGWRPSDIAIAPKAARRLPWEPARATLAPLASAARPAAVMTAVTCLVIAPWLVRNYLVHGELVFIKSTFGYAFWQGNNAFSLGTDKVPTAEALQMVWRNDGSIAGMNKALWTARYETIYIDDLLLAPADKARFQTMSEPACCRELGRRANAFIAEHPGRYLQLCRNRLQFFLLFDRTNPKALHPVYQASTLAWLVLAVIGLFVSRRDWRTLWPTYAIFLAVLLFHTLTITSARFRIPVEPLTFPWCAAAVAWMASWIKTAREANAAAVPLIPRGSPDTGDSPPR